MKQETVITKRVMWYISINGRDNSTELVDTYMRLDELAHAKNKCDTGVTGGGGGGRSQEVVEGTLTGGNIRW